MILSQKSTRKNIALKTCAIICFPIGIYWSSSWVLSKIKRRRASRRARKLFEKNDFPVLAPRKRALTLPLIEQEPKHEHIKFMLGRVRRQTTDSQSNSMLFTRLPPEVRLIIWNMLLDGTEITIEKWWSVTPLQKRPVQWWAIARTCRLAYA